MQNCGNFLLTDGTWNFTAGINTTPQLQEGKANLILEATSNGLLRKTTRWEREVMVVTRSPIVSVDSDQHYLYLGMADLATFNIFDTWTEVGRACRRSNISGLAYARRKA